MINWPANRFPKQNAFVVTSTDFGPMLVNRFDQNTTSSGDHYGVGYNFLNTSSFDPQEINLIMQVLVNLRNIRNKSILMLDAGANVGAHALSCGRLMTGWGEVVSFEAQERIFYALAGNVAMNNLFNVHVRWNALGDKIGEIRVPIVDYFKNSSFGSLEINQTESSENIGQELTGKTQPVTVVTIDSLGLQSLDFLKIDVEKMEEAVINGAAKTIKKFQPVMHVEQLKSNKASLHKLIKKFDYKIVDLGADLLAYHKDDPIQQIFVQK
jgi:FkbM family methyltransferase